MQGEAFDRGCILLLRLVLAGLVPLLPGLGPFVNACGKFTLGRGFTFALDTAFGAFAMLVGAVCFVGLSFTLGDPRNGQRLREPVGVIWARRCILLLGAAVLVTYWGFEAMDAFNTETIGVDRH